MLSYPFVDPFLVKTFDISDDPKIITKLTAAENYKSIIEKIYIKNKTSEKIVVELLIGVQKEEKVNLQNLPDYLVGDDEEFLNVTIDYYTLQDSMMIERNDTKKVNLFEDFIIEPNEFLLLKTQNNSATVDCFVSQIILKSS